MSVKVRYRKTKSKTVISLDVYFDYKRYQKNTGLVLLPETNSMNAAKNVETMQIVKEMIEKVNNTIEDGTFNFEEFRFGASAIDEIFSDFVSTKNAKNTKVMYNDHLQTIKKFASGSLRVQSFVDKKFLISLLQYLKQNYSTNTYILRIRTLKNFVNYLLEMELVSKAIWSEIPKHLLRTKAEDVSRSYLSIEELKILANSDLRNDIKQAFLFSCYTGLRKSDIFALKFSDIRDNTIYLRQQKTQQYNQIPLSKPAIEILSYQRELRPTEEIIFAEVPYTTLRHLLASHCRELLNKDVYFHAGRHTFAINALSLGMPITTLQSFLGHSRIEMTLKYAKILPADKIKAIQIFDNI